MSISCDVKNIVAGSMKTIEGIGLELQPDATSSICNIKLTSPCVSGTRTKQFGINRDKIVDYVGCPNRVWRITYITFINSKSVDIKVCEEIEETPAPPPPPPDDEPIDYEKIEGDTRQIAVALESSIVSEFEELGGLIHTLQTGLNTVGDSITQGFDALTSDLKGVLTGISNGLSDQISGLSDGFNAALAGVTEGLNDKIGGVLEAVTGGMAGVSDKIDGLQFPTVDSIKEAFLDVCADLATALWDAILDKIEERYPDDDKESD